MVKDNLEKNRESDPAAKRGWVEALKTRPEIRIALIYVLVASVWIASSDLLVEIAVKGPFRGVFLQTFKGLNFVFTTGVLLFFVLRKAYGGWRRSEERRFAGLRSARERYRQLFSRTQNLREEERSRISREIHDELGQHLTGLKMQLRLIENRLSDREDRSLNPVIDELVEASGMVDETISSVRRISSGLRPPSLDDLGLAAALDEEADEFTRRTGIDCDLKIGDMDHPIPREVETAAFRIFQESLTNVARHSKARRIDPTCSIVGGVLTLTVVDDGIGINSEEIERPTSLGLVGMSERAADAGGNVDFRSAGGKGTEVVLTIPVSRSAKPALVSYP